MTIQDRFSTPRMSLGEKLWQVNWTMVMLIIAIACIGFVMLVSAANGSYEPWASRQMFRFGVGLAVMLVVALIDIRIWLKYAYLIYALSLGLLGAVEVIGMTGMGAQRWINLGLFQLQPSELMKIALVLALARYFHGITYVEIDRPALLLTPLLMVAAPSILMLRQPDLGTAGMLVLGGGVLFFGAGVRIWKFVLVLVVGLTSLPVVWTLLHGYQKERIFTFFNPERDPLGAGYHILQSKIALGSGGIMGKGFMAGTQSHLNFLPEKQTDFIFTMLAEEFGIVGAMGLLALYSLLIVYGLAISWRARNQFARLLGLGVTSTFFLYVFANIAMVTGLIPVVGVPLPLISYGGTAMLTVMIGFGFLMCVYIHRDIRIGRSGLEPVA
jgi:rod shape determining protein RodA